MAAENSHSRYAHICASCASFLDGEDLESHVQDEAEQAHRTEEHADKPA
jgi:hypothetical protein